MATLNRLKKLLMRSSQIGVVLKLFQGHHIQAKHEFLDAHTILSQGAGLVRANDRG